MKGYITKEQLSDSLKNEINTQLEYITNDLNVLNYERVNVKDFGALGDGIHDDSDAIQDAINFALNLNGKTYSITPHIVFPKGEYVINKTIIITKPQGHGNAVSYPCHITIEGEGRSGTKLYIKEDNIDGLHIYDIGVNLSYMTIMSLQPNSSALRLGLEDNEELKVCSQSTFKQLQLSSPKNTVVVDRIFDSSFYDCFIYTMGTNATEDVSACFDIKAPKIDNSNNITFVRCHWEISRSNSYFFRAIGGVGRADGYHHGFHFVNCHFETRNYSSAPFYLEHVNQFVFERCQFTRNAYNHGEDKFTSRGCVIKNSFMITFLQSSFGHQGTVLTSEDLEKGHQKMLIIEGNTNKVQFIGTGLGGYTGSGFASLVDVTKLNEGCLDTFIISGLHYDTSGLFTINHNFRTLQSIENKNRFDERYVTSSKISNHPMLTRFHATDHTPQKVDFTSESLCLFNGITDKGGEVASAYASTHTYSLAANQEIEINNSFSNNTNRRGIYNFIVDAPNHYFAIFHSYGQGVHPIAVGNDVIVTTDVDRPEEPLPNKYYVIVNTKKAGTISILNTTSTNRKIMLTPFCFA